MSIYNRTKYYKIKRGYDRIKTVGSIVINTSDPEKDIYSLELDVPFGELNQHDKVIFLIRHE